MYKGILVVEHPCVYKRINWTIDVIDVGLMQSLHAILLKVFLVWNLGTLCQFILDE